MKIVKKNTEEKRRHEIENEIREQVNKFFIAMIIIIIGFGIYVLIDKSEQPTERMDMRECIKKLRSEGVPDEVISSSQVCIPEN